jgi:UPF0716 protein FxsA
MSLVKCGFISVILLPAAEIAAFIVVALLIGWFWTLCLFLATTALGVVVLRRSARADLDRFRAAVTANGVRAIHLESPGLGPMLAGILLVIPGFITDALGAFLLIPAVRRRLVHVISRSGAARQAQRDPAVVDLAPTEWHQVPDPPAKDGGSRSRRR